MNDVKFKEFIKLNRGFDLPNDKIVFGEHPVVASTNIKGFHNNFKGNLPKYGYYYLKTMHLELFNSGAGVPTLNLKYTIILGNEK